MGISRSTKGARMELLAAAWLIERGYEVFRNVSPAGPADLVVWRPGAGEVHFVDVKTRSVFRRPERGIMTEYPVKLKPARLALGIKLLTIHPVTLEIDAPWAEVPQ